MTTLRLTDDELTQVELALYARVRHADARWAEHPDDTGIMAARYATLHALQKVADAKADYAKRSNDRAGVNDAAILDALVATPKERK